MPAVGVGKAEGKPRSTSHTQRAVGWTKFRAQAQVGESEECAFQTAVSMPCEYKTRLCQCMPEPIQIERELEESSSSCAWVCDGEEKKNNTLAPSSAPEPKRPSSKFPGERERERETCVRRARLRWACVCVMRAFERGSALEERASPDCPHARARWLAGWLALELGRRSPTLFPSPAAPSARKGRHAAQTRLSSRRACCCCCCCCCCLCETGTIIPSCILRCHHHPPAHPTLFTLTPFLPFTSRPRFAFAPVTPTRAQHSKL